MPGRHVIAADGLSAPAFFTIRAGGVSLGPWASLNLGLACGDAPHAVQTNRARVAAVMDAPVVYLRQVHGARVVTLSPEPGDLGVADAFVCTTSGLAGAILVADCLPVLFSAPGGVAGAHAGWRGLAAGVLTHTLQALCAATGCAPAHVQTWLGPCIGPQAFEVGPEVPAAFGPVLPAGQSAPHFLYQPGADGSARWRADLVGLARAELACAGVRLVTGGQWCTVSEPERFFSYRRDRVTGRMAAVIRCP